MSSHKSAAQAVEENISSASTIKLGNYRDASFAILFAVNCLIIFGLSMSYGIAALTASEPNQVYVETNGKHSDDEPNDGDKITFIWGTILITSIAVVLSVAWVFAVGLLASKLVSCTVYLVVIFNAVCGVILLVIGNVLGGVFAVAIAISSFAFFLWIKDRIEFAAVNMSTACAAIKSIPSILFYAYLLMAIQVRRFYLLL